MGRDGAASSRPRRSVSIQNVAERAKVSIATVSRAINKPHLVSPETARRVHEAVEALGYRPNRFAQALMTRQSGVLALALPELDPEPYAELVRGADAAARARGYHVLVSSLGDDLNGALGMNRAMGLIDGLVAMAGEPDHVLSALLGAIGAPLVIIGGDERQDAIAIDHADAVRCATGHLIDHAGAASCYYLGGDTSESRRRAGAFRRACIDRGCQPRDDQIRLGERSICWGAAEACELIRRGDRGGVLCGGDEIACGVLRAAEDAGVAVPSELSVVSYGGTRIGELMRPRLSTVRVPLEDCGRAAIGLLIERLSDPEGPVRRVRIAPELIVRESSAA